MKRDPNIIPTYEVSMTAAEFMESYNQNMPAHFPHVTTAILEKFKLAHPSLFKAKGAWSLDQHRKRMIEWLPQVIAE